MSEYLELASFDQIADELMHRFDNVALIANKPTGKPGQFLQRSKYAGDPNILLGLLATVQYEVLKAKSQATQHTEDV